MLKVNKIKLLLDLYDEGLETSEEFITKVRRVVREHESKESYLKQKPVTKKVVRHRKNKKWTAREDRFIKKELKAGKTQPEIARKLNVRDTQLKHRIRVVKGLE